MLQSIVRKIVGTKNDRELKRLWPIVEEINELGPALAELSDDQLRAKTGEFRERLAGGATLDDVLPEAFAVVREASVRTLGMRHFDVQLIGGMVLHSGKIAEMKTGEGKTLVATLPVYLNALDGQGVHVVTVNDYLARRDAEWMGRIHRFLGLSVGVDPARPDDEERQAAYNADITYGQNNEFGFDYLRDNMKFNIEDYVHRTDPERSTTSTGKQIYKLFNYAIVDEVDSILIDEARTPLIISGPAEESTEKYYLIDRVIPRLQKETDFTVDEKTRNAILTEDGIAKIEKILGVANLYDPADRHPPPRQPGAARARHLQARRRLRGEGRRGPHRRRVHRPPDAGPALVRRPAPGGRGEGGRQDRAREPDARDHHLPELLPHVQEARRA